MNWYPGIVIAKDPEAKLDWLFDFTNWLATGATIASYTVTVATGLTLVSDSNTSTGVLIWVSGGTLATQYDATVHVVDTDGREDDRTITFSIEAQ